MENCNLTQAQRVLAYMEQHGGITQLEALQDLGVMRLASRISDLRRHGHKISGEDGAGNLRVSLFFFFDIKVLPDHIGVCEGIHFVICVGKRMVKVENRYGEACKVKRYSIIREA